MRTKKNAHKKNARKRRTNKSVKRRKIRTLTRKRSYKYQRRGGVKLRSAMTPPVAPAAAAAAAAAPAAAPFSAASELGRFYQLGPPGSSFRPLYLTVAYPDKKDPEYELKMIAQSIPPLNPMAPALNYEPRGMQIDDMLKTELTNEVNINRMIEDGDATILTDTTGVSIRLNKDWKEHFGDTNGEFGDILGYIKSNYSLTVAPAPPRGASRASRRSGKVGSTDGLKKTK